MRILHGPLNIGNQPWTLSRAERRQGASSDVVLAFGSRFQFSADDILSDDNAASFRSRLRRYGFGFLAALRYDVMHYYFGKTFLTSSGYRSRGWLLNRFFRADLFMTRKLGKKIFMTLQGCDARIARKSNIINKWTMCSSGKCSLFSTCVEFVDSERLDMIRDILPLCDKVFYLNPEIGHFVSGAHFLPYSNTDIIAIKPSLPTQTGRPRIVHAPTDSGIKGTTLILNALDQLKGQFDFDLVLIEDKTHAEAMALYRSADLAIDQVLAGWYGGVAVEWMAMGKPVAAYIRDSDLGFIDQNMRRDIPILQLRPSHLVEDLAAILSKRSQWRQIGEQSRQFVEKWHNPDKIARAMLRCYRDPRLPFVLE